MSHQDIGFPVEEEAASKRAETLPDEEVVALVRAGDTTLYSLIVHRHRPRLWRIAWGILHDDAEAEDAVQDAYIQAFSHLHQFAGRSSFSTWLTRIAICEAAGRRRRLRRVPEMALLTESDGRPVRTPRSPAPDPERQALDAEMRAALDALAGMLPEGYRSVFVLREIEEMSTTEAARRLRVSPECVKTRLHRARLLLRRKISRRLEGGGAIYPRLPIALLANRSCCQRVAAPNTRRSSPRPASAPIRAKVVPMPAPAPPPALYIPPQAISSDAVA